MIRYIPGFIKEKYHQNIHNGHFKGFALFFDIADFTPVCTQFLRHGKPGADELSIFLNYVFEKPIDIIYKHGGFVSLFAGDAFCAFFQIPEQNNTLFRNNEIQYRNESILHAIIKIRDYFKERNTYNCAIGTFPLKIRQTLSFGKIYWKIFKLKLQNEYLFHGQPLKTLSELAELKKDLIFSKESAESIGLKYFIPSEKKTYILCKEPHITPLVQKKTTHEPKHHPNITGFINPKYQNENPQPEIRSAAFCFANLEALPIEKRAEAMAELQFSADKFGGLISRYDATDKGLTALIIFGMPRSEGKTLERISRFALDAIGQIPLLAIGLAKGNVYAGYTGSGPIREYTALGNSVNLAARLMTLAEPGEILTDDSLYMDIRHNFQFKEKGSIKLKGISEPITIHILLNAMNMANISKETEFIGRDHILSELRDSIKQEIIKNRNPAVYIYGNAGIGKSRLIRELMNLFSDKAFCKFYLHCDSVLQKSQELIRQLIRHYFPYDTRQDQNYNTRVFRSKWKSLAKEDPELKRIESIIASFLGYEWEKSVWSMLSRQEKPEQLKKGFLYFMQKIAEERPLMIHIDDIQWIDDQSRNYLQALSNADIKPIIIINSSRFSDDGSKPELKLEKHIKIEKDLGVLDQKSSKDLIKYILKLPKLPNKTLKDINSRAMGNPFFIEQICKYLIDIKKLDDKGNIIEELGPIASFEIRDIIGARIDRLADNVRDCLYNASVLGMEFNIEVLSRMLKKPLETPLNTGRENLIWKDLDELHYIFSHILIKDIAYLRIMHNKLKILHSLAAEAMEIYFKDKLGKYAEDIALHYKNADKPHSSAYYYDKAGCWYKDKYFFSAGEINLKKAIEIRKSILGIEDPNTAQSINNLANLYYDHGKYQNAEPLFLEALNIRKKVLGIDHPDTATSINDLAELYNTQGKYEKAEKLYLQALAIREKIYGKEHQDTARSINDLSVLYSAQGRYDEAEPLKLRALEICKRTLGQEHHETGRSLNNLGILNYNQGKYEEAEEYYLKALNILKTTLGEEHPRIALSLNNLASVYYSQGKYTEAEPLFIQALEIRMKILGMEHPDTAISMLNLASLYKDQGKYQKSEEFYIKALKLMEKNLGKYHPHTASSYNNLGLLYYAQGKYPKAEELFLKAMNIWETTLGEEHPNIINPINNLSRLYRKQRLLKQSEQLSLRALKIIKNTHSADHPYMAISLNNLASIYCDQGKYTEAEPLLTQSLEIRVKTMGMEHPHTAESMLILASLYKDQGKYQKSEELYLKSLKIMEKTFGKDHTDIAISINNLAHLYQIQGKYDKAEKQYLKAISIFQKALGSEHHMSFLIKKHLADLYKDQGKHHDAEELYIESIEILKKTLGLKDPNTISTIEGIIDLYNKMGQFTKAEDYKALLTKHTH